MGRGRPFQHVELTDQERTSLERILRRQKAAKRDHQRAWIALLADQGWTTTAIAKRVQLSKQTVSKWRGRVALRGADGLQDAPRKGRPRHISVEQRLQLVALACEPDQPGVRPALTIRELAAKALRRGIVGAISHRHLKRILDACEIRPHRIRYWLHSPDPDFRPKVNAICDLYHRPPTQSVVLSIDEKTGIQALERKIAGRPPGPGQPRREEFEYIRHGTQALIAALDVHTGHTLACCGDRRTQEDLFAFMQKVADAYPQRAIHVVWDNLNTHQASKWEAFNKANGERFHFHYTPLHASWVNQIELLFSTYGRQCLRHASFESLAHLRQATAEYFEERNKASKPFKWSFRGFHLQSGERKRKPGRRPHAGPVCGIRRC